MGLERPQVVGVLLLLFGAIARGDHTRPVQLRSPAGEAVLCSGTASTIARVCSPSSDCMETAEYTEFLATTVAGVAEKAGRVTSRIDFGSVDCWIASIDAPHATGPLQTTAWPRAMVEGTLVLSDGNVASEVGALVKLEDRADEVLEQCRIVSRKWQCPIPATRVSLRLIVPGYAPRHLWGVHGVAGATEKAGLVEFHRGATIIGSLRSPTRILPSDIVIDLVNESTRSTSSYARTRANGGKFEFTGLPPGAYRVIARSRGLSPAESPVVAITSAPLYDTGALHFRELTALKVLISPPSDYLQRPWHVIIDRVSPGSPYTSRISDELVKADGWCEKAGLEGGLYAIAVADATGSILERRRVAVDGNTAPVEIHLSQIEVRGRVMTTSNGVPANIVFTSTGLQSGRRASTKSDDDGYFKAVVPNEGPWNIRIELLTRHAYVVRHNVDIHRRYDAPYAELDLSLPPGTINGVLVNEKGDVVRTPLDVMLFRDGKVEADVGSDDRGQFSFFGLADGTVTLRARSPSIGDSGLVRVEINGDVDSTTRLVLTATRTIKGVIETSDGYPVSGAVVRFAAESSGYGETVAGPGGTFELKLPAQTTQITAVILATGLPVHLALLPVIEDDKTQQVTLLPIAGRLSIPMTASSSMPMIGLPGGAMFAIATLVFPPDGSSGMPQGVSREGFDIALTPGVYQVCPVANGCEGITIREGEKTTLNRTAKRPGK